MSKTINPCLCDLSAAGLESGMGLLNQNTFWVKCDTCGERGEISYTIDGALEAWAKQQKELLERERQKVYESEFRPDTVTKNAKGKLTFLSSGCGCCIDDINNISKERAAEFLEKLKKQVGLTEEYLKGLG